MGSFFKSDTSIISGLILLSLVPVLAGLVRLNQVMSGVVSSENARFLSSPWPVGLHIVAASLFGIVAAFQFAPRFRSCNLRWHRMSGRLLILCGLIVAVTGVWMTQFYPTVGFDGPAVYWMRLITGTLMFFSLVLAVVTILKRNVSQHKAWMIRAYAIGMGAGTQVITHLPWLLFPAIKGELSRAIFMGAGWIINLGVAELIIRRR